MYIYINNYLFLLGKGKYLIHSIFSYRRKRQALPVAPPILLDLSACLAIAVNSQTSSQLIRFKAYLSTATGIPDHPPLSSQCYNTCRTDPAGDLLYITVASKRYLLQFPDEDTGRYQDLWKW